MWSKSSSASIVNLEKKFVTVPEISNFSYGVTFLAHPVHFAVRQCVRTVFIYLFTDNNSELRERLNFRNSLYILNRRVKINSRVAKSVTV